VSAVPQGERKRTQRERLVSAMTDLAARDGFTGTSIAKVIALAGVSRPTFYEYFADKEDCFLAALAAVQPRLLAHVRRAVRDVAPQHAMRAAVRGLIGFAQAEPAMARLAMNEPMVCAGRALDARDQAIAQMAQTVEDAHARVPASTPIPDVASRLVIGGVERQLAYHLCAGQPIATLLEDLLDWLRRYEVRAGEHRWRSLEPMPPPPASPFEEEIKLRSATIPAGNSGRGGRSAEELTERNRRRILLAAAQLAASKGYHATTIAEIGELAEVNTRALRRLFADKQEVFAAVHELHFQSIIAVTTRAFFAGANWPERVWEAGRAFTQSLAQNPDLAHVSFVEYYAGGSAGVQRNSELVLAFTVFLQEGYQYRPSSSPPSRVALAAIAATNFETVYQRVRAHTESGLPGLLPHAMFLELAPFLGATDANRFIDEHLQGVRARVAS
jgi:AcrR family transcriptional regulator